jgi:PST family polysaccharide transporter
MPARRYRRSNNARALLAYEPQLPYRDRRMSRPTLGQVASRAVALNVANTLVSRMGTFLIGVALARILGPEEFGTFAVALLVLLAILSFNELGVSLAIVRWSGPPREIAPTVATISTASSVLLAGVAIVGAPTFCAAMGAPAATPIVRVLAASMVIDGLVATSVALLQRDFRAGRRMVIDQVNSWLGAVVSIAAAVAGMGAMSLAVGRVAGAAAAAAMFIHAEPVRLGYDHKTARRLFSFGLPLAASSIVFFAVKFVDQFMIGHLLGPVALGFYVLAFNLSSWPVSVFSQPVREVSPAAFSRLREDPGTLRDVFVSSVGLLTAITLPVCLVLSGAADPIVSVVYGSAWAPAAAALGMLGLLAGLRIVFELFYDYFVAVGSPRVVLAVQIVWFIALVPALYIGAELGDLAGAAAAQVVVAAVIVLPMYLRELHRAGIEWRPLARTVALPAGCGAAVAAVALAAAHLISLDLLALAVAGAAMLAALVIEARRVLATVRSLRAVAASS